MKILYAGLSTSGFLFRVGPWPVFEIHLSGPQLREETYEPNSKSFDFLTIGWYSLVWANKVTRSLSLYLTLLGATIAFTVKYGKDYDPWRK